MGKICPCCEQETPEPKPYLGSWDTVEVTEDEYIEFRDALNGKDIRKLKEIIDIFEGRTWYSWIIT